MASELVWFFIGLIVGIIVGNPQIRAGVLSLVPVNKPRSQITQKKTEVIPTGVA